MFSLSKLGGVSQVVKHGALEPSRVALQAPDVRVPTPGRNLIDVLVHQRLTARTTVASPRDGADLIHVFAAAGAMAAAAVWHFAQKTNGCGATSKF
jgi:hypothetical protein